MVFEGTTGLYECLSFQFQMNKKERKRCEFETDLKHFFCLPFNLSNDDIISAERPGLKTDMDFKGLVRKQVWKVTFFGLKSGHNLENPAAHPQQEFPEVPPPPPPGRMKKDTFTV